MGYDPSLSPEQTYNEEEGTTTPTTSWSRLWTSSSRCPSCAARQKPRDNALCRGRTVHSGHMDARTHSVQSNAGSEGLYLRMIYGRNMTNPCSKNFLTKHPGR